MAKYVIIDEDTGEIVSSVVKATNKINIAILAKEVNELIKETDNISKEDFSKLLSLMYARGEMNKFHQITLDGKYVDTKKTFSLMGLNPEVAIAYARLLDNTSWNNMVKFSPKQICSSWEDLHNVCEVQGTKQQARFKRFLTKYNIVKKVKCVGGWRMFVNPTVNRSGSNVSQKAIVEFWEDTKDRISPYSRAYFYANGDVCPPKNNGK